MKLTIEVNDKQHIQSYLSMIVLGALDAIRKEKITHLDLTTIFMHPLFADILEEDFSELAIILHLAEELRYVKTLMPEEYEHHCDELKEMAINLVHLERRSARRPFNYIIEK